MKKLSYFFIVLSPISLIAQEIVDYQIKPIHVTPRLSAVQFFEGGTFQLQPIDLSVDLRLKALRKQQGLTMRQNITKPHTNFKIPNLSPKVQEPKKGIQFSVESRDFDTPLRNNFGYGNTFYNRRYIPYTPRINQ